MYDELTQVDIDKMKAELEHRRLELRPKPVGKAILGKKVGDRVEIVVSPEMKYTVEIRSITPGEDDASLEISSY